MQCTTLCHAVLHLWVQQLYYNTNTTTTDTITSQYTNTDPPLLICPVLCRLSRQYTRPATKQYSSSAQSASEMHINTAILLDSRQKDGNILASTVRQWIKKGRVRWWPSLLGISFLQCFDTHDWVTACKQLTPSIPRGSLLEDPTQSHLG